MRRREQLLIGLLLVAIVGYLGQGQLVDWLWRPWQQQQAEKAERHDRVAQLEEDFEKLQADRRALAAAEATSLPDDPAAASTLYHRWLVHLAADTQLDNALITPSAHVEAGESLIRIPVVVTATARLAPVRDFLAAVRQAKLQQKITYLRLEAEVPGDDPPLQLTMQLEGLAIRGAGAGATDVLQSMPSKSTEPGELSRWAAITDKNLFRRGYSGPPPPAVVETSSTPPAPPPDMAQHVYLVGLLTKGTRREIWLHDRMRKQTAVLVEGEKFDVAGVKGQVLAVSTTWALFLVEGQTYQCSLGRNLRQLERVEPPTE